MWHRAVNYFKILRSFSSLSTCTDQLLTFATEKWIIIPVTISQLYLAASHYTPQRKQVYDHAKPTVILEGRRRVGGREGDRKGKKEIKTIYWVNKENFNNN